MTINWQEHYAKRSQRMARSIIRELLKMTTQPDLISLAGGLPAPELFPIPRFEEAACKLLENAGSTALQYGQTEGFQPLREFICAQMGRYGIQTRPSNVVITNGSQQALDLMGKVFIDPGDRILVEEPTYLGALHAWTSYQAEYVTVPIDDYGLRTDMISSALQPKPKFMYILPNFQNPSGTTLSLERREELVRIANDFKIPILEDDPYGALRFEGDHLPPLVVLDSQFQANRGLNGRSFDAGCVIYLGTFSKTLAPGLRLGWVVAPDVVLDQFVIAKQGADLHTSMFTQMLVYEMVKDGFLDEHVPRIREVYRQRRDIMLKALERNFPEGCSWTTPLGGLFLWVRVPEWLDTAQLLPEAINHRVAYVPGFAFFADPTHGKNTMRLNFSNMQPQQIEEGIKRLGVMLKKVMAGHNKRIDEKINK
jgi:2-aminoadipate transaminase